MFQDEARVGRINDSRRCWSPWGIRPVVHAQMVREYIYVYGAVSPVDGVMDSLILPCASSEAMSVFLAEVSRRHQEELILMVIDGAGWHTSNELDVPDNIVLLQLPPYSPELNPAEHLWEELREKWFPNRLFTSMDALVDHLADALRAMEADTKMLQSLTGFSWILEAC